MANPIPTELMDEFGGYLDLAYTSDLPDGAWFQCMEDDAAVFMKDHHLKGSTNDAVHQFLSTKAK